MDSQTESWMALEVHCNSQRPLLQEPSNERASGPVAVQLVEQSEADFYRTDGKIHTFGSNLDQIRIRSAAAHLIIMYL